jgi:hypothetical protein
MSTDYRLRTGRRPFDPRAVKDRVENWKRSFLGYTFSAGEKRVTIGSDC